MRKVRLRESYYDPEKRKEMSDNDIAIYKKYQKKDSYQNAVSNVVKLNDTYIKMPEKPNTAKVYIEGIGTISEKGDETVKGTGLGYRYSGVRGKVFRGCYEISALPILQNDVLQTSEVTLIL